MIGPVDVERNEEVVASVGTGSVRSRHAPVTLRVPFAASSVSLARRELKSWMLGEGSSREHVEDARVVISELVGNAVRHAQPLPDGTLLVAWRATGEGLEVSVTDGGSGTRPHKVHAGSSALAGRGMAIVESLALTWWAEQTRSRCTVHALLPLS